MQLFGLACAVLDARGAQWLRGNAVLVVSIYAGLSLLTFVLFAWDKSCARRGARRVSERTLHLFELCGGWPGALAGQRWLRHKSEKRSYRVVLWLIVALHLALWSVVAWTALRGA